MDIERKSESRDSNLTEPLLGLQEVNKSDSKGLDG